MCVCVYVHVKREGEREEEREKGREGGDREKGLLILEGSQPLLLDDHEGNGVGIQKDEGWCPPIC